MKPFKLFAGLCLGLAVQLAVAGPKIDHWTAPSGARVYFVENHALPIVDVQIDLAAGSAFDPSDKSGTAALTHALLDLGTGDLDETQIANRLADLGAKLSGGADNDRASLSLRTLSSPEKRTPALALLRHVLTTPLFPASIVEREKARRIASLKDALTRPETIASKAFWASMYPDHPYGTSTTPESLSRIKREDLLAFYRAHYTARRAVVSIVGDLTRLDAENLAAHLTAGLPEAGSRAAIAETPRPAGREQRIDHPAAQAHLLIGMSSIQRGDPDFFPLLVGNYSLGGGGFVSRLMKEVRDKRGLAYSVYSYFQPLAQAGPFQIGLQTRKNQANEALRVTRAVLTDFLAEGPDEAELTAAKQNLTGSFPLRIDSNRKILENVALIGFYKLPADYLDNFATNVEQVSAAQVKAAFARHVRPEQLSIVIVGAE